MRFRKQSRFGVHTVSVKSPEIRGEKSTSRLSLTLEWGSLLVAVLTVCVLPWLLGGAIPKARLVLQIGAAAAAVLTLLARLVSLRAFAVPPIGTWLLLGLAAIGIMQLQPWMPSAISLMNHAVYPEFRDHLPKEVTATAGSTVAKRIPANSRSVAPAETRRQIAQWIAAGMLLCVVADSLSQSRQLMWMLTLMCVNASLLTILSLQQQFDKGNRGLCEPWIISRTIPFGSFVNPNNAAGWLLVHVAMAIGLVVVVWGRNPSTGWSRSFNRPAWRDRIFEAAAVARSRLAALNNIQILSIMMVVLLLSGVAATLSRSGIVAGVFGLVVCAASRLQFRKSLLLLAPFSLLLAGAATFLMAFELDTLVLAELRTLKDPVSESTGRLLHWSDSLRSVLDFPIIGSGQGVYAWSTLPYQRRGGSTWFMNADNQYVEILVESGFLGLVLFVGFGILLAVLSIKLILRTSKSSSDPGLWDHRIAIGLAGVAMIASQAIAAFFDFGVGLSSTMAAIAVFGGVLTAINRVGATSRGFPVWYALDGRCISWILRLAMLVAACTAIPELRQADQVYPAVVETARLFDGPVTRDALKRLPQLNEQFTAALKEYPDDLVVRNSLVSVLEAQYRLKIIEGFSDSDNPPDDEQLQTAWNALTPFGLAYRVVMLQQDPGQGHLQGLRTQIITAAEEFPWQKLARETSRQFPLAPGLAAKAAAGSICYGTFNEVQSDELTAVRFADAAGMDWLYQCGMMCLLSNSPVKATEFWNQSLEVSETFRVGILLNALRVWTPDQAMKLFGPAEYAATVRTAVAISDPGLKERLWTSAEAQWRSAASSPTVDQRVQRAFYLLHRETPAATLKWIDECLLEFPEKLELRRLRAETLEKTGELDAAIGEWTRYGHYDPASTLPKAAVRRLMQARIK
jgi:O-antigen ligase